MYGAKEFALVIDATLRPITRITLTMMVVMVIMILF